MPLTASHQPTPQDNRRGILSMLAASAAFVAGDTFVRLTAAGLPTGEIMVLRGIMATSIVVVIMLIKGELHAARALSNKFVLARSIVEGFTTTTFIMALPHLPLADVTSIVSAAPLFMTAMIVMLGLQTVGWRRWAAIVVGFIGVLLVVQPSTSGIGWPAGLLILCAIFVGVRDIISRQAPPGLSTLTLTLGTTLSVTVVGALLGLFETWVWPQPKEVAWLASAACLVATGNFFIIRAFRGTDPTVVTPFRYVSILTSVISGFLVWREVPNAMAALGALLIIGSGVYTIWREKVRAREALDQPKNQAGAQ